MATKYGVQATKRENQTIPQLEEQGHTKGQIYSAHDSYTLTADLAAADVIKMMRLPEGARVVDARMVFTDLDGSGGTLDVGWQAGASAAEAADADGFLAVVDVTSAGSVSMFEDQSSRPGYNKTFTEEVQVTVATVGDTDATSGTIDLEIWYVID